MSATGYEETELTYNVNEEVIVRENMKEGAFKVGNNEKMTINNTYNY